jgi:hypothetical protein
MAEEVNTASLLMKDEHQLSADFVGPGIPVAIQPPAARTSWRGELDPATALWAAKLSAIVVANPQT